MWPGRDLVRRRIVGGFLHLATPARLRLEAEMAACGVLAAVDEPLSGCRGAGQAQHGNDGERPCAHSRSLLVGTGTRYGRPRAQPVGNCRLDGGFPDPLLQEAAWTFLPRSRCRGISTRRRPTCSRPCCSTNCWPVRTDVPGGSWRSRHTRATIRPPTRSVAGRPATRQCSGLPDTSMCTSPTGCTGAQTQCAGKPGTGRPCCCARSSRSSDWNACAWRVQRLVATGTCAAGRRGWRRRWASTARPTVRTSSPGRSSFSMTEPRPLPAPWPRPGSGSAARWRFRGAGTWPTARTCPGASRDRGAPATTQGAALLLSDPVLNYVSTRTDLSVSWAKDAWTTTVYTNRIGETPP